MSAFIIGFPGAVAKAVAERLAKVENQPIKLLAAKQHKQMARSWCSKIDAGIEVVEGSCQKIDFGLSGRDYMGLAEEVTSILYLELPGAPGNTQSGSASVRLPLREVVELGLAAKGLTNMLVLSHVDVAGNTSGVFMESDLELGQGFKDVAQEDRLRGERILRRFMDRLPVTVARSGWVIGEDKSLCPLVQLLLAARDLTALPAKERDQPLNLVDLETLSEILAKVSLSAPEANGRTLHLTLGRVPATAVLVSRIHRFAAGKVPEGFDLAAAARRALRGDKSAENWWSARHFFRRQPTGAQVSTAYTRSLLAKLGLELPEFDVKMLEALSERELEKIVGFK